jgi:hypothetical protein
LVEIHLSLDLDLYISGLYILALVLALDISGIGPHDNNEISGAYMFNNSVG